MTFLELRNTTYKLIDEYQKEKIAYSYLINKFSNKSKIELISSDQLKIDFNIKEYMNDLYKYLNGQPIQKVVGSIKLANIDINLDFNVLIPRLETEEFIYNILNKLKGNEKILDLCCGSGFIGLALKKAMPKLNITLSDIDDQAILQTIKNAKLNKLNVKIIKSDLFENITEKFDVIICNPPYINIRNFLNEEVTQHEPHIALFAKDKGLFFYKKIIMKLHKYLNDPKLFLIGFEIGEDQGLLVSQLLEQQKFNSEIVKDISHKNRFIFSNKIF